VHEEVSITDSAPSPAASTKAIINSRGRTRTQARTDLVEGDGVESPGWMPWTPGVCRRPTQRGMNAIRKATRRSVRPSSHCAIN